MWKSEYKKPKDSPPYVILRRNFNGTNIQVIVAKGDGFKHRQGYRRYVVDPKDWSEHATKGVQVQISMNGTAQLTFAEFDELYDEIGHILENL